MPLLTQLSERRGFEFSGLGVNTLGILLIKAPIELVSPTISELLHGVLETDAFGREYDSYLRRYRILHQYRGHDWTIICPFDICASGTVAKISEQLQVDCIYLENEDTSGCSGYKLFVRGACVEEFDWGCDYTEEVWEVTPEEFPQFLKQREAEGNPLPPGWDYRQWNVYCLAGYCYRFRSYTRAATCEEVKDTDRFLDKLFRAQDAWLPDWEYLPWSETIDGSQISASDLVRVDVIHSTTSVNEVLAMVNEYLPTASYHYLPHLSPNKSCEWSFEGIKDTYYEDLEF